MNIDMLQPTLENEKVELQPLRAEDFDRLFEVASDPKIWEQHPNKDRYKKEVFKTFFEGALASGGAFIILDRQSGEVIGSSRFYSYDQDEASVFIGYTFYATKYWGTGVNREVKTLMLDYIFKYAELVKFHVGENNLRSRAAMEKLGAEFRGETMVAYHGEETKKNVEYWIRKEEWQKQKQQYEQKISDSRQPVYGSYDGR